MRTTVYNCSTHFYINKPGSLDLRFLKGAKISTSLVVPEKRPLQNTACKAFNWFASLFMLSFRTHTTPTCNPRERGMRPCDGQYGRLVKKTGKGIHPTKITNRPNFCSVWYYHFIRVINPIPIPIPILRTDVHHQNKANFDTDWRRNAATPGGQRAL